MEHTGMLIVLLEINCCAFTVVFLAKVRGLFNMQIVLFKRVTAVISRRRSGCDA